MNIALSVNWNAFSVNWNALSVGYGHHGLELRALRFCSGFWGWQCPAHVFTKCFFGAGSALHMFSQSGLSFPEVGEPMYGSAQEVKASRYGFLHLGRALGHFIFSLIGLKMILFTNIFQKLSKPHLVHA